MGSPIPLTVFQSSAAQISPQIATKMAATILRIATNPVEYMQAMDATQLASLADDVFKAVDFALQDAEPAMAPPEDGAPQIGSQETVVEALNTLRACAVG